jgi:membrane-associated phospholipid phosphatase
MRRATFLAFVAVALAGAQTTSARADEVHELRHDDAIDIAVTGTAIALTVFSEIGKGDIGPQTCRWCEDDGLDRAARSSLRWNNPARAAGISNLMGFIVAPATASGTLAAAGADAGAGSKIGTDELLLLEAVSVGAVVNQAVKFAVGRERPFVHALPPDDKEKVKHASDNNVSFYSGHTSLTMTLAAAGGTIATLRGYRLAPLVWGTGGAISLFTGYLRIAADKHYLTDVLTGAAVGALIGIGLPVLFHGREPDAPPTPTGPTPGVISISGGF